MIYHLPNQTHVVSILGILGKMHLRQSTDLVVKENK